MAKRPPPTKRFGSRPAILPKVKDRLKDGLLEGIDQLGTLLKTKSTKPTVWKIVKGKPRSPWLAFVRYRGSWDWTAINRAFKRFSKPDAKRLISYSRLAVCAMHFEEYDRRGKVKRTGWFTVTSTTTWENLLLSIIELSNESSTLSHAIRYERSIITAIVFSFGSKTQDVSWVDE